MKYCSHCGHTVQSRIPEGDNRQRYVCDNCHTIHYQNPRIVVGSLPVYEDKVLLCRRAIEPRKGFWTLPGGFMENGESTLEGALRETWEEAQARLNVHGLYRMFDLPHIDQLYIFYRGDVIDGKFAPGPESTEVALYAEEDIPWEELAFLVVRETLKEYFDDRKSDQYPVRVTSVSSPRK